MTLRLATAAAFIHDRVEAHFRLLEKVEVDIILLLYLDEESIPLLALQRERDAGAGYVWEVTEAVRAAAPRMFLEPTLRLITDAGGLNPYACAAAIAAILVEAGSEEMPIGVVHGDDLRDSLEELYGSGCPLEHTGTRARFRDLARPILAAHAELGAQGVYAALAAGAKVVIAGHTAASSMAVAAAVGQFGWDWDDWDRLASAAVAGNALRWSARQSQLLSRRHNRPDKSGSHPLVAELAALGQVSFRAAAGGEDGWTHTALEAVLANGATDPAHWLTPDVDVDLTSAQLAMRAGRQDVLLWGATGRPAAASYQAALWYHDGSVASADLLLPPSDSWTPESVADVVLRRVQESGFELEHASWQTPGVFREAADTRAKRPLVVRLTAADRKREAVEQFATEVAAFAATSPVKVLSSGGLPRPAVVPLVRRWPTVVPRELAEPTMDVRPAAQWL